ncbi:hypothetical protein HDU98_006631 [Podochytrium sp. JEL0797]|nr:hypothetical protein HDU98_006631 [Podochytrium sp. JEL0797]
MLGPSTEPQSFAYKAGATLAIVHQAPGETTDGDLTTLITVPHPRTGEGVLFALSKQALLEKTDPVSWEIMCYKVGPTNYWLHCITIEGVVPCYGLAAWQALHGSFLVMTPFDPLFLLLPLLENSSFIDDAMDQRPSKKSKSENASPPPRRFEQLENFLYSETFPMLSKVGELEGLEDKLKLICDVDASVKGMTFYKLNDDKTKEWLLQKANKLLAKYEAFSLLKVNGQWEASLSEEEKQDHRKSMVHKIISDVLPTGKWQDALKEAMGLNNVSSKTALNQSNFSKAVYMDPRIAPPAAAKKTEPAKKSQTQANTVANTFHVASTKELVLKQGWMLKKAGTGVFAQWKLKYLVLAVNLDSQSTLKVFDQCDQSKPPKYTVDLKDSAALEMVKVKREGVAVAAGAAGFGKKGFLPFILYAKQRKIQIAPKPSSGFIQGSRSEANMGGASLSRRSSVYQRNEPSDAGEFKNYGRPDSDCVSVVSSVGSLMIDSSAEDGKSYASSSFETLSFCSEPVLTQQELLAMGNGSTLVPSQPMHMQLERTSSVGTHVNVVEKWNERYQKILSQKPTNPESVLQKDIQLLEVIGAFEESAVQHAIRMVDEHHLQGPLLKKQDSGIATASSSAPGAMFVDGMILHFACDYDVASPDEVDAAMSRTSSELRCIDVFNRAAHDAGVDINTALMILIDYKGFRVVAYADMGIDERTVPLYDLKCNPLKTEESALGRLSLVGKELNLKTHGVQIGEDRRVNAHLSWTLQVHNDQELGRNYAVNLFEIMPMDYSPQMSSACSSPARSPSRQQTNTGPSSPSKMGVPTPFSLAASSTGHAGPTKSHRLRPEFVKMYTSSISSDAFTPASGCGRKERELNDSEAMRASRYLRETWIPGFVKHLDELEMRPLDSTQISGELHKWGVNVRYLGVIALLSHIPYIRDMMCIEMVARAFKAVFVLRLRGLMIKFRSVGATQIEEETKAWTAKIFSAMLSNGDKSMKFFDEIIRPEILHKYNYDMEEKHFISLHRPAIFAAMQYQCGVVFEEASDYNFSTPTPCPRSRLLSFTPRRKHPTGLKHLLFKTGPQSQLPHLQQQQQQQPQNICQFNEDDRLAYALTRHFRSMGPKSKLQRNDLTAMHLTTVAAHYNATDRPEEAKRYAVAAIGASTGKTTCSVSAIARAQVVEAMGALMVPAGTDRYNANISGCGSVKDGVNYDFNPVLKEYRLGVSAVKWNWGLQHPMGMALHDRMSAVYVRCGRYAEALEFHNISLDIAVASFGKNHVCTAGYFTKAGILLLYLQSTDEALAHLNEALQIYRSLNAPTTHIAQVHSHIASALDARGDSDGAISHAQKARKMWETARGQMDPRSIAANLHTANLLLKPFEGSSNNGSTVLTPNIKAAYRDAINCFEKVFRFVNNGGDRGNGGNGGLRSSRASVMSSRASTVSIGSYVSARTTRHTSGDSNHPSASIPLIGPAVLPPFSPLPQLPKNMSYKLTKKIVTLKLALVESPRHREVVRTLRMGDASLGPVKLRDSEFVNPHANAFDQETAREVVVRMSAVSPSIYLDGIFARIEDDDGSALDELAIAIQLVESDTVGLAA